MWIEEVHCQYLLSLWITKLSISCHGQFGLFANWHFKQWIKLLYINNWHQSFLKDDATDWFVHLTMHACNHCVHWYIFADNLLLCRQVLYQHESATHNIKYRINTYIHDTIYTQTANHRLTFLQKSIPLLLVFCPIFLHHCTKTITTQVWLQLWHNRPLMLNVNVYNDIMFVDCRFWLF